MDLPHLLPDLQRLLVARVACEMKLDPDVIDRDRPFTHYGLDSITALTIAGDLEDVLSIHLESTVLWDCPTINSLAMHLQALLTTVAA